MIIALKRTLIALAVPVGLIAAVLLIDPGRVKAEEWGEIWKRGDRELDQNQFKNARNLYLEALAAFGRKGQRPGFLLYRLGQAEEGMGNRKSAWNYYLDALESPWGGPPKDAESRNSISEKLAALAPPDVPMQPVLDAYDHYMKHLSGCANFKDSLITLRAMNRQLLLDSGNEELAEERDDARGRWLQEELSWQLQKPKRVPIRKGLKTWTWRYGKPRVVGGNRVLVEADVNGEVYIYLLNPVEGSFIFEVDLRQKSQDAPAGWGFMFGDDLDGEAKNLIQVIGERMEMKYFRKGKDWSVVGSTSVRRGGLLTDRWHRYALHHDSLTNRIRLFKGNQVLLDMKLHGYLYSGRLGVHVRGGALELCKASLATDLAPD